MNSKIDIKSALVGLGAGVLVALVAGAESSPGGGIGRYRITSAAQNGNGSECFIIDTVSGRVWKASVGPNCGTDAGFFKSKEAEKVN